MHDERQLDLINADRRRLVRAATRLLGPAEAETPVCGPPMETAPPGMRNTGVRRRGVAIRGSMPPR